MTHQPSGPADIEAVLFDNAGTIVDFGCFAPVDAFIGVFKHHGISVTASEVRGPMGLAKRDHIVALLQLPSVAAQWTEVYGREYSDADVDTLYADFLPLQIDSLGRYRDLIPGAMAIVEALRGGDIKIGTTTGYPREVMDRLVPELARQGFVPSCAITASDVPRSRPEPDLYWRAGIDLGLSTAAACINVDDSPVGLAGARRAGMWAVGLSCSGNATGIDYPRWAGMSPAGREKARKVAAPALWEGGAHYVVDTVADLLPVVEEIRARLQAGETPDMARAA